MYINVNVEIYNNSKIGTIDVKITEEEIKELAEKKTMESYDCISCKAKEIKIEFCI